MILRTMQTRLFTIWLLAWLGPWEMALPQAPPSPPLQTENHQQSIIAQIETDFSKNLITLDEWARFAAYSAFEPQKLPTKYLQSPSKGLSTYLTTRIFQTWDRLHASTRRELQNYGFTPTGALSPPDNLPLTTHSAHFSFHYSITPGDTNAIDSTDSNANGVPDYVDTMIAIFEQVYTTIVDSMKFTAPPSDSGAIGDDHKYDIFILKMEEGIYGYTAPFSVVKNNPASSTRTEKNAATSYIVMANQYQAEGKYSAQQILQVTAAHEFFHAVQMGYDVYEKAWLMESTAAWVEDEVYDDINQNITYLIKWFRFSYYPLDATASEFENRWYGSWIFFRYISEHLGGHKTIRRIWEKSVDYDSKIKDESFSALNDALTEVNSSFKSAFRDFSVANVIQTVEPYHYEEAKQYPSVYFSRILFNTRRAMPYVSLRHGARYFQIRPNALPGELDEIEFTVVPQIPEADIELIVATRTGPKINTFVSTISGGVINFSLEKSSTYDEIYAILVNLDTLKTNLTFDVEYKGSLIRLSSSGAFRYGQLADGYYVFKRFENRMDGQGETQTDMVVRRFLLSSGYAYDIPIPHTNAGDIYLAQNDGDLFIVADNYKENQTQHFGLRFGTLKPLAGNFQVKQYPAVDRNTLVFYGEQYGAEFKSGIFLSNLSTGPPGLILDLTNTDATIDVVVGEQDTFVALKRVVNAPDSDELVVMDRSAARTFYVPDSGYRIQSLVYDDQLAAWSEIDAAFSQRSIKAYDFSQEKLIDIRSNDGVDPYSLTTAAGRVAWWENTGGATKIQVWEGDSIRTIRATFNGLYLNNNGVSSNSIVIPMDRRGAAWMETNFTLYYYDFATQSLNRYDLSDYFSDRFLTTYLVKVSGKQVIIEALSSVKEDKVGVYLFQIRDAVTGIKREAETAPGPPSQFVLSQNYPNPFNPGTAISYHLPKAEYVSLIVYDITGRRVKTLVDAAQTANSYTVYWDGTNDSGQNVASGMYFYTLKAGAFLQSRRMLLLR